MNTGKNGMTYADAGVDIDAGNALVERIKPTAKRTNRPGVFKRGSITANPPQHLIHSATNATLSPPPENGSSCHRAREARCPERRLHPDQQQCRHLRLSLRHQCCVLNQVYVFKPHVANSDIPSSTATATAACADAYLSF